MCPSLWGREGTEAELGLLVGQIRRMLSTVNVRTQAQCLLTRMNSIGEAVSCCRGGEDEEGKACPVGEQGQGQEYYQKR